MERHQVPFFHYREASLSREWWRIVNSLNTIGMAIPLQWDYQTTIWSFWWFSVLLISFSLTKVSLSSGYSKQISTTTHISTSRESLHCTDEPLWTNLSMSGNNWIYEYGKNRVILQEWYFARIMIRGRTIMIIMIRERIFKWGSYKCDILDYQEILVFYDWR